MHTIRRVFVENRCVSRLARQGPTFVRVIKSTYESKPRVIYNGTLFESTRLSHAHTFSHTHLQRRRVVPRDRLRGAGGTRREEDIRRLHRVAEDGFAFRRSTVDKLFPGKVALQYKTQHVSMSTSAKRVQIPAIYCTSRTYCRKRAISFMALNAF